MKGYRFAPGCGKCATNRDHINRRRNSGADTQENRICYAVRVIVRSKRYLTAGDATAIG
jgi:hypothetical protein